MAAETADPVVQVIHGNEKDIRLVGESGSSNHRDDERQEQNSQPVYHFLTLPLLLSLSENDHSCQACLLHVQTLRRDLNPANSLCEAMGGGKERVAPGWLSPGVSLRAVGVGDENQSGEKEP